jgi:ribose transport system substrate-binding protein
MRNHMRRPGGGPSRTGAALAAAASTLALALAACSSSPPASPTAAASAADAPSVSPDAVQATVSKAFASDAIKYGDLDPVTQETLQRASIQLTQAQLDKAYECWSATSCTVGGGKTTLGLAEAFGQNQWRKITKMEIILQALTYPDIGKIIYTDAQGDLAKYQSNVRSLAAQGAKAIVAYDDFGAAALPAFKAAQQQGAKISAYVGGVPDAPTDSLASQVHADICAVGTQMATTAKDELKLTGQVAILNGTPGNPQGAAWNKCFKDGLSGSSITVGTALDTDWTLAGAFKAASALVSSGKTYTGIFYDYADPIPQVVQAYDKAGKVTPAIVTWTSNNGMAKVWEQRLGTDKEFPLYFTNALTWESRVSVTSVMSLLAGKDVPANIIEPQPFVKAEKGLYQSDRPDDYPGPSVLIPDSVMSKMLTS